MSAGSTAFVDPDDAAVHSHVRQVAHQLLNDLDAFPVEQLTREQSPPLAEALPRDAQLQLDAHVAQAMRRCLRGLEHTGLVGPSNEIPSRVLWQVAGERLQAGELQWRARCKPQGYAGDFRMLEQIVQQYRAPTAWGAAFDQFFQDQAAPQAVRNRTLYVANRIVDAAREAHNTLHVVSVGCGPALDVSMAIDQLVFDETPLPRCTLLDMDPYALEYVQARLRSRLPQELLRTQQVNLVKLPERRAAHHLLDEADLIVCTGLFDYLETPAATRMIRLFWHHLRAGGSLVVFGFSPLNTSRSYMEWIGNWYVIHRTVGQMWELVDQANLPDHPCIVDAEPQGVNLFITATK